MNKACLERYGISPSSIRCKRGVQIIDDGSNKFVLKQNKKKNKEIYEYLLSRNFTNFPKVYTNKDEMIELSEYIEDINIDTSQRVEDLVFLLSLLHSKTLFFKELDLDKIKKIYEDSILSYDYLLSYYDNIQKTLEEEVYSSPSNYYFLLNISLIYKVLLFGKKSIDNWYKSVSSSKTLRFVLNHNNLEVEHLVENNNPYLISWDNADIDFPSYDLANLFKKNYLYIEIDTLISVYQSKFKLTNYEYYLFLAQICMLDRISFNYSEVERIDKITKFNQYVLKVYNFISKQDSNKPNNSVAH